MKQVVFRCEFCGRNYESKVNFNKHTSKVHREERQKKKLLRFLEPESKRVPTAIKRPVVPAWPIKVPKTTFVVSQSEKNQIPLTESPSYYSSNAVAREQPEINGETIAEDENEIFEPTPKRSRMDIDQNQISNAASLQQPQPSKYTSVARHIKNTGIQMFFSFTVPVKRRIDRSLVASIVTSKPKSSIIAGTSKPTTPSDTVKETTTTQVTDTTIDGDVRDELDETYYEEHDLLPVEESAECVEVASNKIGDNLIAPFPSKKCYAHNLVYKNFKGIPTNIYTDVCTNPTMTQERGASLARIVNKKTLQTIIATLATAVKNNESLEGIIAGTSKPSTSSSTAKETTMAQESGAMINAPSDAPVEIASNEIGDNRNFEEIHTNVYRLTANPIYMEECLCKPNTNCSDSCQNRILYIECSPKTCPCGEYCHNRRIQLHLIAPGVKKFETQHKGCGVQTELPIKKDTYIMEYVGEVVTESAFKELMTTKYTSDIHDYCMQLDGKLVIDAHRMGNDCRYVNHSCDPNCEMQKWSVNGLSRMVLFAKQDIGPGEELCFDYGFQPFAGVKPQACLCGSNKCRGVIGVKSQRIRPIKKKKVTLRSTSPILSIIFNPKFQFLQSNEKVLAHYPPFMHVKNTSRNTVFQLPRADGHCFLMRNLRKVFAVGRHPTDNGNRYLILNLFSRYTKIRLRYQSQQNTRISALEVIFNDHDYLQLSRMPAPLPISHVDQIKAARAPTSLCGANNDKLNIGELKVNTI